MGKPPKLLEPLDCPNASKFAKSAFAEFWAVNGKEQYMLMNMKIINEKYDKWNFMKSFCLTTHFKENSFRNQILNPTSVYLTQFQAIH